MPTKIIRKNHIFKTCPKLFRSGLRVALCALFATSLGLIAPQNLVRAEMKTESTHNPYHQNNWSEEQREVWGVIEQFDAAFAANDPDAFFKFVGEEITLLTPSYPYRSEGKPDDREEFEFRLGKGMTRVELFQEMQPYVFVSGDMAFVTFYARGFFGASEKMANWKITDVLQKTAEGWKIIHIHLSE